MYNEINSWISFDINEELLLLKNSIKKEDKLSCDEIFSAIKYEYTVEATSPDFYEIILFRNDVIHAENERQKLYLCNNLRFYTPRIYVITLDISYIDNIYTNVSVFEKQNRENSLGLNYTYSRIEDSVWTEEENIPSEIYDYLHDVVAADALKEILEERK